MKTPNEDSDDRAKQIVKEALGVLMQAAQNRNCPRLRAEDGIRCIAGILCKLSHHYQLHANLKAALWDIHDGYGPLLPEEVRRIWDSIGQSNSSSARERLQSRHPL
jgi:hypothetical protein